MNRKRMLVVLFGGGAIIGSFALVWNLVNDDTPASQEYFEEISGIVTNVRSSDNAVEMRSRHGTIYTLLVSEETKIIMQSFPHIRASHVQPSHEPLSFPAVLTDLRRNDQVVALVETPQEANTVTKTAHITFYR